MLARVVEFRIDPTKVEDCLRIVRDRNAPAIAGQPGFKRGQWFVDRSTGKFLSITLWESPEQELDSRASIPKLLERMTHVLATKDVRQEAFEVVHEQPGWEEPYHG